MDNSSKKRGAGKSGGVLIVLGGILAVVGIVSHVIVLTVIGVILALIGGKQKGKAEQAMQGELKDQTVGPALNDVLENVDYQPDGRLSMQEIADMQLLLHTSYQYVEGSDKTSASYRGRPVLLGNVRLMETEIYREEETNFERTTEKEVWQGLMMTCEIGHTFPAATALAPRGKIDGLLRYADAKTGNEAFDKRFTVKTDNPEAVLLTLTPRMQQTLLAAADTCGGVFHVTFCQNGRVSMAVRTDRNFFLPGKGSTDAEAERRRISGSLRRLLSIIDEAQPAPQEGAAQ